MENWLLIFVGCIFLIFAIVGFIRGAIKIAVSLTATLLTIVIVMFATPYVSDILYKVTPIPDMIQDECRDLIIKRAETQLMDSVLQKVKEETGLEIPKEKVQAANFRWEDYGIKKQEVERLASRVEFPREIQIEAIEKSGLPVFMREKLLENNNNEVYASLGVEGFASYIGAYLSKMVVNIIAFLLTFLVVTLVVRITIYALDFIGELPVLGGLNRLGGAVLGTGTAVIIIWVIFVILTLAYASEIGKMCLNMIADSKILTFLYEHNYIMNAISRFY